MFREITYHRGKMLNSTTVYNNGLIFVTEEDYFKGVMRFYLPNNNVVEYRCTTGEYAILKSGVLADKDDNVVYKFAIKQGKLVFTDSGKELDLESLKKLMMERKR